MWQVEKNFRVIIGGNTYINTPDIIAYKGKPILTIKRREPDGQLGISFDLFDGTGKKIASIRENRIFTGDTNKYSIIHEKDRFALIDNESSEIVCDIRKREAAKSAALNVSVKMYMPDGFLINFSPTETNLLGLTMKGCTFVSRKVGIDIQENGSIGLGKG